MTWFLKNWQCSSLRARFGTLVLVGIVAALLTLHTTRAQEDKANFRTTALLPDTVLVYSMDGDHAILRDGTFWTRLTEAYVDLWQLTGVRLPFPSAQLKSFCLSPGNPWTLADRQDRTWELAGTVWHRQSDQNRAFARH